MESHKKYIKIMCQTTNQKIVPSDVIAGYIGWPSQTVLDDLDHPSNTGYVILTFDHGTYQGIHVWVHIQA
jgi:hypothetical protein